jgi:hypothetical protein
MKDLAGKKVTTDVRIVIGDSPGLQGSNVGKGRNIVLTVELLSHQPYNETLRSNY